MARPKGAQNRKSGLLLRKLELDNNFHVVKELLEVYGWNKDILKNLMGKMYRNMAGELDPLDGFTEQETILYHNTNREVLAMLQRILAYLYPKLKALEVNNGTGEKVVFNINGLTGAGSMEKQLPPGAGNVIPLNGKK